MINVVLSVLVLILLDAALGIIMSIKTGTFNVRKLPKFLASNVLQYVGGLLVLAVSAYIAGYYTAQVTALFYAAAFTAAAKFIAECKDKALKIFSKMDIPDRSVERIKDPEVLDMNMVIDKIVEAVKKSTTG